MASKGTKTKAQKRREAWDKRLQANNGTLPGGSRKASPFSRLFFAWITPLVNLAYARPLEPEHLFPLPASSETAGLLGRFRDAWGQQLAKPKGERSLAKAMTKVFKGSLIATGFLAMAQQMVLLAVPLIVQQLLQWLIDEDSSETYIGVVWAIVLFLVGFCGNGLLTNHYFLYLYVMGMDARTMLNAATYSKSLRLSNKARQSTSTGELVTLMSNDAQRLPDMALSIHAIWSTPLFIVVAVFLLVNLVGAAAVAGIMLLVLMIPIQGVLAAKQMGLQRAQMKQTQSRVKVINEVLQGIRIVKYYAWEVPFVERIAALRDMEVDKIKSFAFVNAYSMSIMLTTPFVMVMLTLVVFFNVDGDFSPDVVFTAVSLLLVIRFPLMMLPMAVASWVQGKVSVGRMQAFFELEELHPNDREWTNREGPGNGAVSIDGKFVWTPSDEDDDDATSADGGAGAQGGETKEEGELAAAASSGKNGTKGAAVADEGGEGQPDDLKKKDTVVEKWELNVKSLRIPSHKLTAVVGQVGSGKSSLVSALLGEMTKVEGRVSIDGSVAYVAQTAWIINATLRENVLMGRPFDEARYQKVLDVCDMKQDLSQLPAGDETEIGDKGINLSGGQKQRVSIARAAYADADVYILDDPLSAVDAHVGRHLFDECLAGFLKGKTVILCANQLQFLPQTDLVLVVDGGRIVEEGSYADLMVAEGGGLAKLMEMFAEDESDDELSGVDNEETKAGDASDLLGDGTVRFSSRPPPRGTPARGSRAPRPPTAGAPTSGKPRSLAGTPIRGSRGGSHSSSVVGVGDSEISRALREDSTDFLSRSVHDASAMMVGGGFAGGTSPVPSSSASHLDSQLMEALHTAGFEDEDDEEDENAAASMGVMANASYRRRRRKSKSNSVGLAGDGVADGMRASNASEQYCRQYSDGGADSMRASNASRQYSRQHSDGERAAKTTSAVAEEAFNAGGALQTVEGKEEGAVALRVFKIYLKDGSGGWFLPIVLVIASVLTQAVTNVFDWWLSYWSDKFLEDGATESWYQYVYAGLCMSVVALYLIRALLFATQAVRSSRHLHSVLVKGVMRAPVSFFDTTPVGRVLNRFTKDMDSIDLLLPRNIPQFVATLSVLIGVMITIIIVLPWFAVAILPVGLCYYQVQMLYRPVNRDLQRLESVSRSPIFAQFSETLNGVSTVRAYNQEGEFINRNNARLNDSSTAFYLMHVSNRWLGIRLEAMGTTMILAAALLIVFSKGSGGLTIKGGVAGLVLTYTQQVTGYLTWTVRMGCEMEARITAVERAQEYADLTPEAPPIVDDYRPPQGWPKSGAVKLSGIKMRYRPGLDLVLKGVSLDIKGGERIGIAGRTGSGKSSLMVTLFRMVEPCGGSLTIDGVDGLRIGLQDLRKAISIIPQDPVMFCGTMRDNLDPFGLCDDVTIWAALEAARLAHYVSGLEGKLEAEVSEGGENLSLGQRQLVCLARAVLRRNKILVMDEATANVDVDTDSLIQEAIRKEFSGCTVLTIAHRLNTIMDSDRILVMEDGKVGEFDTPANLVANPDSLLMAFIRQTGGGSSRRLVAIANNAATTDADAGDETVSASPPSSKGNDGPAPEAEAAAAAASGKNGVEGEQETRMLPDDVVAPGAAERAPGTPTRPPRASGLPPAPPRTPPAQPATAARTTIRTASPRPTE